MAWGSAANRQYVGRQGERARGTHTNDFDAFLVARCQALKMFGINIRSSNKASTNRLWIILVITNPLSELGRVSYTSKHDYSAMHSTWVLLGKLVLFLEQLLTSQYLIYNTLCHSA